MQIQQFEALISEVKSTWVNTLFTEQMRSKMMEKIPYYIKRVSEQMPKTKKILRETSEYIGEIEGFLERVRTVEYFQKYKNVVDFVWAEKETSKEILKN